MYFSDVLCKKLQFLDVFIEIQANFMLYCLYGFFLKSFCEQWNKLSTCVL